MVKFSDQLAKTIVNKTTSMLKKRTKIIDRVLSKAALERMSARLMELTAKNCLSTTLIEFKSVEYNSLDAESTCALLRAAPENDVDAFNELVELVAEDEPETRMTVTAILRNHFNGTTIYVDGLSINAHWRDQVADLKRIAAFNDALALQVDEDE